MNLAVTRSAPAELVTALIGFDRVFEIRTGKGKKILPDN